MSKFAALRKTHSELSEDDRLRLERHEYVKSGLRLAGTSLAALGRELGVKNSTMSSVSMGAAKSKRIQQAIAAALSVSVVELWPEFFSEPDDAGGSK
jgi:lambda repressor-like predicted transcriptional regulator